MEDRKIDMISQEKQVQKDTIKEHKEEFELLTTMLNLYFDGFNLIGNYKLENNEKDWVWLLLLTRSFHSIRCSIELVKKGYYVQVMALIRMVTENYFICGNCEKEKVIVEAIIYNRPNRPNGKTRFNYRILAANMGSSIMYEKDYIFECQFAHCSNLSASIITKKIDKKNRELSVIPSYDKLMFIASCELLFKHGILMTRFMELLLSDISPEKVNIWRKKSHQGINNINKWLDEVKGKYYNSRSDDKST